MLKAIVFLILKVAIKQKIKAYLINILFLGYLKNHYTKQVKYTGFVYFCCSRISYLIANFMG